MHSMFKICLQNYEQSGACERHFTLYLNIFKNLNIIIKILFLYVCIYD